MMADTFCCMESDKRGFSLQRVILNRDSNKGYGFGIRQVLLQPPSSSKGLSARQMQNITAYFVGDIIAGSGADRANMHSGDRIVSVNGKSVTGRTNNDVLHIIKSSSALDLLLIPRGEEFFSTTTAAVYHNHTISNSRRSVERRHENRLTASYHRLHSISEHSELVCQRRPFFRSMVFGTEPIIDGPFHIMDSQAENESVIIEEQSHQDTTGAQSVSRKSSIDSHTSIRSNNSLKQGTRSKSFDSIQLTRGAKLTFPSSHTSSKEDINTTVTATSLSIPYENGRHTVSTDCLVESSYPTSAKLNDHFPQKVLTPSNSIRIVEHPVSQITRSTTSASRTPSTERLNSINTCQAPVATLDDQVSTPSECSPEDTYARVIEDDSQSTNSNTSGGSRSSKKVDDSPSSIRFLPAYRGKTVEEMMSDLSPRPVWHTKSGKYPNQPSSNHHRGNSVRQPPGYGPQHNVPPNYNNSTHYAVPNNIQPQSGRNYSYQPAQSNPHPQQYYQVTPHTHQHQQPRKVAPITKNRPQSFDLRRINDGTHPKMQGPMRAITPHTYHGMRVHVQPQNRYNNYPQAPEPRLGSIALRRDQMTRQSPPTGQYHTMSARSRPRISSDSSSPNLDQDIRTANSENDVTQANNQGLLRNPRPVQHSQSAHLMPGRPESVPSGKYMASSSMSSLPQYAQLVTHPGAAPPRAESAASLRSYSAVGADVNTPRAVETDLDTRHSYTAGSYNQLQKQPKQMRNLQLPVKSQPTSHDDIYLQSSERVIGRRGPKTPTSPVNRQPSYLNAMGTPIRQRNVAHEDQVDNSVQSNTSPVITRSVSNDESHTKIIRRTSYLMATSKPDYSAASTQNAATIEEGSTTPNNQKSSIRKLKNFFGERTPSIREAQESASQNQASSTTESYSLPENLEVNKAGILAVKVVAYENKRSSDRSWKAMGAALCGHMLYLLRDKKENATLLTTSSGSLSVDDKPISIKSCHVDIAHGYTKKKHVFKLITLSGSEYLLQAEDHKDMVSWIKAIDDLRNPDKEAEQISSAELVKRIYDQQQKLNQKRRVSGLSFRSKQGYSPSSKSSGDSTQKKDKKRQNTGTAKQLEFGAATEPYGDFGRPLHECSPSHENEHVPLVVEQCTKAIEEHGLEFVGVYRVPGNKAGVELLKSELNKGVINPENEKWRDVNVLSSLLKEFLRKLPDPLIPTANYKTFIETNRIQDRKDRLLALKHILNTLPDANYETLKYLCAHLTRVSAYGHINKMDTRNLAIVFGPTIVRSGDDVMSLVTDMSDQCSIIENLIVYYEWVFSDSTSDPPEVDEGEVKSSVAPISETMSNMKADITALASNKKSSKSQLLNAFTSAANKNMSKSSLGVPKGASSSQLPNRQSSSNDDHGFKDRNIKEEAAARNQRLLELKERESQENLSWVHQQRYQPTNTTNLPYTDYVPHQHPHHHHDYTANLQRWHSEESVLDHARGPHHHRYKHDVSSSDRSEATPPPLPARGVVDKPPLPPKPMDLYHAKPAHALSTQTSVDSSYVVSPRDVYENFETLQLKVRYPPHTHHRALHVIHNPVTKSHSLPRRGSLDSMMDSFEPYQQQYTSSSSTESQDGSDLLSSMTATFDEKLKLLTNPKFRLDGKGDRKLNSDSSSIGSTVSQKGHPDSPMTPHTPHRNSTDRSRESLMSAHSNKEFIHDRESSDRGFAGSTSSIGSGHHIRDPKVGIASRIERTDIKPIKAHLPINNQPETTVINATGNVVHHHHQMEDISDVSSDEDEDEEEDYANNNNLPQNYESNPLVQRCMSDEKKKIRRRHTVGGARDFELFKDILAYHKLKDGTVHTEPQQQTLTAWQRLQPRDNKEPLSLKDWMEKERFRASSPELERNIMHFQHVAPRVTHSVLQTNT